MRSVGRAVLLAFVSGAFAIGSSTALADTFTLNLSLPSSGTVGKALVVTASGDDPTDAGALYLEIDAIPTSLATTCPSGYLNAEDLATSTPDGALVTLEQPESFDSAGNFSNVNAWVPAAAGTFLLCSYTDDYALDTLATTSKTTNITSATSPVSKPVNTRKPHVTRAHNRLLCSHGSWSTSANGYAYRWTVNGKTKQGARASRLAVTHKLRGRTVRCTVTASNTAGSSAATSPAFKVR